MRKRIGKGDSEMTVKELMEKLAAFPAEMEVRTLTFSGGFESITKVRLALNDSPPWGDIVELEYE